MQNILLRGCPGTGKTIISRALAYYLCKLNEDLEKALSKDFSEDFDAVNDFIDNDDKCEYIQIHPSMDYEDIVYGLNISVNGAMSISYAEKRIVKLCNRAKGKKTPYCVIFDDINRTNVGSLLGNVLYAMEYRDQDVNLSDGAILNIPDNVILIFTENTLDIDYEIDFAFRRRMTYLKDLLSSRDALRAHYSSAISKSATNLIIDIYDRVRGFIENYTPRELGNDVENYIPGHGMFMVERCGTVHHILDTFRQKVIYQIAPYLRNLYAQNIISIDPEAFINSVIESVNVGVIGICPIVSISKKLVKSGTVVHNFSLNDSYDYYVNTIVPVGCTDFRGMMECVLDAVMLNGILPLDVLFSLLLKNTNIAYVESLSTPIDKAALIIEKNKANKFKYQTIRGGSISGTHAYYTLDVAATGRWAAQNDTEEYVVSYRDGRSDEEYIPLSGFRNHGFNPDSPSLSVNHNTIPIMSPIHILLQNYYECYRTNLEIIIATDSSYTDLYNLLVLEQQYLEAVKDSLTSRKKSNSVPTGDSGRLAYYGEKISKLKLLWSSVDAVIEVDGKKFDNFINGVTPLTIDDYEDLYNITTSTNRKSITVKGVLKMVNLTDYQAIMDSIGVRQMIFQGPPGTSKTFESKRFVLEQLNPSAPSINGGPLTQESIASDLEVYRLTDDDYADPQNSPKLQTGGWDLVQFHPSYGYEDFIRGIEVKIPKGSTTPSYESINRILGKMAEFAKIADSKSSSKSAPKFYLIIDEINRANLATVFGELIYGLEYRNSTVSTPYEVHDKLLNSTTKDIMIGKNLYILGTMNTADKSIDTIDYAIRRRFIFIDSPADRNVVLKCYQNVSGNADENSIELLLYDAVQCIFDNPKFFNKEYRKSDVRIGHTFFIRSQKKGYGDEAIEHFIFQVLPILREYVKDGILETSDNLINLEHTVSEIHSAPTGEEQLSLLSENIMLYIMEFGNLNKSNALIDNAYIGKFIDELQKEYKY